MEDGKTDWWESLGDVAGRILQDVAPRRAEVDLKRAKRKAHSKERKMPYSTWSRISCGQGRR